MRLLAAVMFKQNATERGSVTPVSSGWKPVSGFSVHRRRPTWALGCDRRWERQCLDLQLRHEEQSDRAAMRRAHRELPARLQDRRPDFATRWLCRRRPSDADRPCDLTRWRRLGDGQLAGHRCCYRHGALRGNFDPLWWPGRACSSGMAKPVRAPQIGPARGY